MTAPYLFLGTDRIVRANLHIRRSDALDGIDGHLAVPKLEGRTAERVHTGMAVDAAFLVDAEHGFLGLGQAAHVQRAGFAADDHGNAVVIQRGAGRFRHLLKVGGRTVWMCSTPSA